MKAHSVFVSCQKLRLRKLRDCPRNARQLSGRRNHRKVLKNNRSPATCLTSSIRLVFFLSGEEEPYSECLAPLPGEQMFPHTYSEPVFRSSLKDWEEWIRNGQELTWRSSPLAGSLAGALARLIAVSRARHNSILVIARNVIEIFVSRSSFS